MFLINFIKARLKNETTLFIPFWITCFIVVSFIVAVPVYLDGLNKLTVVNTLKEENSYNSDLMFTTQWMPMIKDEIKEKQVILDNLLNDNFFEFISSKKDLVSSQIFFWGFSDKNIDKGRASSKASFITIEDFESNIKILEGSLQLENFKKTENGIFKVLVHHNRKDDLNISVGDVLKFLPVSSSSSNEIKAIVAGSFIVEGDFLMGMSDEFFNPKPTEGFEAYSLPLLVSEEMFFDQIEGSIRGLPVTFWSFVQLNRTNIEKMNSNKIIDRIRELENKVNIDLPQITLLTQLDTKLTKNNQELFFIFIPILIILSIVLGFGITILMMFSFTTTLKRQIDSINLIFRGAKKSNLLKFLIIEWIPISLIIIIISPLITVPLVRNFISSILINMNIMNNKFPIIYQWNYFLLSGISMIGCLMLVIISFFALKTKQSNLFKISGNFFTITEKPFFQKYFIDILLAALCFALIWETRIRIFKAIDQQEMASFGFEFRMITFPLMLMFIFAIIFLRVFPIIFQLLDKIIGFIKLPFGVSFGITQISRNSYWYSWLMLIFIFSISGTLAISSIHRTMEINGIQKVSYETISDVRLIESSPFGIKKEDQEKIMNIGNVDDYSTILRSEGSMGTTGSGNKFEILAIEPEKLPKLAWFRNDFGKESMDQILRKLSENKNEKDLIINQNFEKISITAKAEKKIKNTFLWIVLKGNDGRISTVTLGQINHDKVSDHIGDLSKISLPAKILAVQVYQPGSEDTSKPFQLYLEKIEAIDFENKKVKLISFSRDQFWSPIPSSEGLDTIMETVSTGINLDLGVGSTKGIRGIYRTLYKTGIPAIVDKDFLKNNDKNIKDEFVIYVRGIYVPVIINGEVDYFPSSEENHDELMIFDLQKITNFLELMNLQVIRPNEVVLKVNQNNYDQTLLDIKSNFPLAKMKDKKTLKEKSLVTPLAIVGWKGISSIAFWVLLVLVLIGYYGFSIINQEATKSDNVILGVLGVSKIRFLLIIFVEQSLLLSVSMLIGIMSGITFGKILNGIIISLDYRYLSKFPEVLVVGWFELIMIISLILIGFIFYLFVVRNYFKKIILSETMRAEN